MLLCGRFRFALGIDFHPEHLFNAFMWLVRFVNVLVGLNSEERKAFLQFTTGCSSLPPGGLANLHPRYHICHVIAFEYPPTPPHCSRWISAPEVFGYRPDVDLLFYHYFFVDFWYIMQFVFLECLSRIRIFSIPDPGSKRFRITDPHPHQRI